MKRCRKRKFPTIAKARKHLRRFSGVSTCRRAYMCPICSTRYMPIYHLTSQTNEENREISRSLGKEV